MELDTIVHKGEILLREEVRLLFILLLEVSQTSYVFVNSKHRTKFPWIFSRRRQSNLREEQNTEQYSTMLRMREFESAGIRQKQSQERYAT